MALKPSFLLTAGQRRQLEYSRTDDLLAHYADIYASRFVWENLPEGVPEGWVERSVFWNGCVGAKEVGGVGVILPAGPVKRNVYGYPITWVPTMSYGTQYDVGLFDESDMPAMWLGFDSPAHELRPYCETMAECLRSLRTNVAAMRTPVLVKGTPGVELQGELTKKDLKEGEIYIPGIDGSIAGLVEVLDLHVTDHTQALVNTIRAMDAECLTHMAIMNAGTGRESGVTSLETGSISQLLTLIMKEEERVRERWRDEVNDRLGWDITFRKNFEGWNDDRQEQQTEDGEPGDTDDGDGQR